MLVAVLLWMLYLLPSWRGRFQYNAAERNAVRLNQALRILAETSETPAEVHVELNARTALAQQKLAKRVQSEREAAELESLREELAATRADPVIRRARARRRVRMVRDDLSPARSSPWSHSASGSSWPSGPRLLLWLGGSMILPAGIALQRMAAVANRAARATHSGGATRQGTCRTRAARPGSGDVDTASAPRAAGVRIGIGVRSCAGPDRGAGANAARQPESPRCVSAPSRWRRQHRCSFLPRPRPTRRWASSTMRRSRRTCGSCSRVAPRGDRGRRDQRFRRDSRRTRSRAYGAVGSAPRSHRGGQGFESPLGPQNTKAPGENRGLSSFLRRSLPSPPSSLMCLLESTARTVTGESARQRRSLSPPNAPAP